MGEAEGDRRTKLDHFLRAERAAILKSWTSHLAHELRAEDVTRSGIVELLPDLFDEIEAAMEATVAAEAPEADGALSRLGATLDQEQIELVYSRLRRNILERWRRQEGPAIPVDWLERLELALERSRAFALRLAMIRKLDGVRLERDKLLAQAKSAIRAREDLLAIVSHDLRNPLSTIVLSATLIESSAGQNLDPRLKKKTEGILRAAAQMTRLVGDLLDLARTERDQVLPLEKAPCDGTELARQAVDALEPLAFARHLRLATDFASGPCVLSCDADRIQQVLSNLIGNALKFTPEGGVITVSTGRAEGEIVFTVADSGVGISAEELAHVFEPYWQAKAHRKGVGLGLAVVKAIVEAHQGRFEAISTLGVGSTFIFALPAAGEGQLSSPGDERGRHQ
jgi:signal transduction histidine kinase